MAVQPSSTRGSNGSNVISLCSNESLSCCWSAHWSWKRSIQFIILFTPSSISSLQLCSVISTWPAAAIAQYIFIFNSVQVEAEVFKVPLLPDPFPSNRLMSFNLRRFICAPHSFVLSHVPWKHIEGLQEENSCFWASASVRWDDWWMLVCAENTNGRFWFPLPLGNVRSLAFMTEDMQRELQERDTALEGWRNSPSAAQRWTQMSGGRDGETHIWPWGYVIQTVLYCNWLTFRISECQT